MLDWWKQDKTECNWLKHFFSVPPIDIAQVLVQRIPYYISGLEFLSIEEYVQQDCPLSYSRIYDLVI